MPRSNAGFKPLNSNQLDAIFDEIGYGKFHLLATIAVGLRFFISGTIISIYTNLEPYFQCKFGLTYFEASFYLTGTVISCFLTSWHTGVMGQKYGKRRTMILFNTMNIIFSILNILANGYPVILLTSCVYFLFDNAKFFVYPYLMEIIPIATRKYLVCIELLYVLGFSVGTTVSSQCIKYLYWQYSVLFCITLPLLAAVLLLLCIADSPRHLLSIGDKEGAVKALVFFALKTHPGWNRNELRREFRERLSDNEAMNDCNVDDQGKPRDMLRPYWGRIIFVGYARFVNDLCRAFLVYGSGQTYHRGVSNMYCNRCEMSVQTNNLLSVASGLLIGILITYHVISRMSRKTAVQVLFTLWGLSLVPLYFDMSAWLQRGTFLICSIIAQSLSLFLSIYNSEMVPTSIRGYVVGIDSAGSSLGQLLGVFMASYIFHEYPSECLIAIQILIFLMLVAIRIFAVETRDASLH